MKNKLYYFTLITFILLFLYSCANVVPLEGGIKDTTIPVIKKTNLTETNFKSNKIILDFNEYVDLNNADKNISIQPFHSTIKTYATKKNITIEIDSTLKENTTYVLKIDGGIKDANEGNLYTLIKTFSTGSSIDSAYIELKIIESNILTNYKVGLSTFSIDSFKNIKFDYISKVNNNTAEITGLKEATVYNLVVFNDENNDNIPDKYKPLYFDTIRSSANKNIYLIKWIDETVKIIEYKNAKKFIKNNLSIFNIPINPKDIIYSNNDSLLIHHTSSSDSFSYLNILNEVKTLLESKLQAFKDKNDYRVQIEKNGIKNIKIKNYPSKENTEYIEIISKSKIDSLKILIENDSFWIKIKKYEEQNKLSHLIVKNKNTNAFYKLIITQKEKIILNKNIYNNNYDFYLPPGEYNVEIYEGDLNNNITANPNKNYKPQPAKVNKKIILKANWEEEILL